MNENWYAPPAAAPAAVQMRIRGTPQYGWMAFGAFAIVTGAAWVTALFDLSIILFQLPPSPIATAEKVLGGLDTLMRWGGIVAFLIWVHRTVANQIDFGYPTGETPGAAVASFFIPSPNFVLPIRTG